MPQDDFFEATFMEFTQLINGEEKIIVKFDRVEDLSSHLIGKFKENQEPEIFLEKNGRCQE